MFFHSSVTVEDVADMVRSKCAIRECAALLKESLKTVEFELDDSFCDEQELRISWKNVTIPDPVLAFFAELFKFRADQFDII